MHPLNVLDPIDDTDDVILISLRDVQFSKEPDRIFVGAVDPPKVEDGISFNFDNISFLLNDVHIFSKTLSSKSTTDEGIEISCNEIHLQNDFTELGIVKSIH